MNAQRQLTVSITRRFNASAERVFDAWLDPAKAGQWLFATASGRMVRAQIDARVGGSFSFVDRRDGENVEHLGTYLEIVRPSRLVFTFAVANPKVPMESSRVLIDIVRLDKGCELTLTHEGVFPDYATQTESGWTSILDGLARTISEVADAVSGAPDPRVRELYEHILRAWNRRDAAGMAARFEDDGNVVGFDGSQADSRPAIENHLRPVFASHPTAAFVAKVREIRMLCPESAILRAVAGMVPPGSADINPAVNTIHTLVATKRAGGWRAALFQSTPAAWHGRPQDGAALTDELRDVMRRGLTCE
jgi:uncharacterized protein (TIGR02246 family)